MEYASAIHDPLTINLKRQAQILLSKIPSRSPYATALLNASTPKDLLAILSSLLVVPSLTLSVATAFRPLLVPLCAQWLDNQEYKEEKLVALSLLVQPHEELFPILSQLLRKPSFQGGPLAFLLTSPSVRDIDGPRLHRLLLAYYRILLANCELPYNLLWSLSPLSMLFWTPHPDTGVRLLAIRCYAMQSGMGEDEREKLETEILGDIYRVNCQITYDHDIDGSNKEIDGWVLPALEAKRITDARNSILTEAQDYYTAEDGQCDRSINSADLSPYVVNIHGILLLRFSGPSEITSSLIHTPMAVQSLRALATHLSLRLPTLITSPPSSGKSLLLSHLAATLHPGVNHQIINIHFADTSLDPRSLLGAYVSSPTRSGTFEWTEGVLVRAMREGRWVVFKDIDRGSNEVLGVIKPLVESLRMGKWIGGLASLEVPNRGRVNAHENFALFATRSLAASRNGKYPPPVFFGAHKFHEIVMPSPTPAELSTIINAKFPRLAGHMAHALIRLWDAVKAHGSVASTRDVGYRELEKFCARIENLLASSHQSMDLSSESDEIISLQAILPNTTLREEMYLEARDVFFGAGTLTASAYAHAGAIAVTIAEHLGLEQDRRDWVLQGRTPEFHVEKDMNGKTTAVRVGRTRLLAKPTKMEITSLLSRPFAMHRPAVLLLSRIANALSLGEPVLLTGETGTGKTSVVTHLASLLNHPLISLNLSHQTESSDLVGGFKPIDARVPASQLQERFLELFGVTFSRRKNAKFDESVRKAVLECKWKRAVGLWRESVRLAKDRILAKQKEQSLNTGDLGVEADMPRKRRKMNQNDLVASEANWNAFQRDIDGFEVQHVHGKGKFAFGFVEGPLVKALRSGDWILLDEINLTSPETLECISGLLHSPTATITLTEQGSLEPIPRHPDFRLFACMNPATDVGKKDLPLNIRSRFTEIDVPPPDADRETLLSIVTQYIGPSAVGDKAAIMNVAEFYSALKTLVQERLLADGSNRSPHYSMRTLARALTFAADTASMYGLRRSLWEGCLMAFTMVLDGPSAEIVTSLAQKHILAGVRNPRSLLSKVPSAPRTNTIDEFVKFGHFYLEKGPLPEDPVDDYIITPSVEKKLIDLARIMVTRRYPVLIEGPTSSGKTSSVEYLARRTGHRFIRINNHEHTDIQEYLGSYIPDPTTGKLVFKDGLLVRALRDGDWIVLDELNLAPTDVLEALNRLLDDNRELVIPETQEVLRPHPHFMLFATQNPPGLYAGRKVLSRAFRSRFLEVHFEDVPQAELESILCQKCRIAPSYCQRIVSVFRELQKRRQSGRVFESKHGFATLRDLFRWAGRDANGYQELAENGYMLLGERTRREDDKSVVKEVIELEMKVKIDEKAIYNLQNPGVDFPSYLACPIPLSPKLVWTSAMQRLFILVARALRFNEPVLLVGETGSGKTSACQIYADAASRKLHSINCHQHTETADLIGGLRPVRNRSVNQSEVLREVSAVVTQMGVDDIILDEDFLLSSVNGLLKAPLDGNSRVVLEDSRRKLLRLKSIFEWRDGPLVEAMRNGDIFLLDEISLADDSVLERLNSVLEPARSIVLAERGGDDFEHSAIQAMDTFQLVATMNPGGDYGKKELSPALRNRFTEIWVPPVYQRTDMELIVSSLWENEAFIPYTTCVLNFGEWLCTKVGDRSLLSLRDILAWVDFSNVAYKERMPPNVIFHHAAHLTLLDGLGSLPQLASYSSDALLRLRADAVLKLEEIVPCGDAETPLTYVPECDSTKFLQFGPFTITKGPEVPFLRGFNLEAPTTRHNAMRVVRACQLPKSILLEGSPGVGKTSLITALANISGHALYRINLSDQTDLADLFGSDLPVEGGGPGDFAWKDAEFLKAMQEGHWVLLDEMNLAPQAVLEGLNAVLDHRGVIYIPELGRSFTRHPAFRIFAAQNPLHQGGGRKGLPKSFVNRFTKVYLDELSPDDLVLVCQHLFPDSDEDILRAMVTFNTRLNQEIGSKGMFAREGGPWEYNLRDVIRWGLLCTSRPPQHPVEHLNTVYLHRFRTVADRNYARFIFDEVFSMSTSHQDRFPRPSISSSHLQIGHFHTNRRNCNMLNRPGCLLQAQLPLLETAGHCIVRSWLSIITGPRGCGKTELVRSLAYLTGNTLREIFVNSATDTMDIVGSFEQVDNRGHVLAIIRQILSLVENHSRSIAGSRHLQNEHYNLLRTAVQDSPVRLNSLSHLLQVAADLLGAQIDLDEHLTAECENLIAEIQVMSEVRDEMGRFEWVDGPFIQAMKQGHWVLLDDANLCNPSVLDRLNSLCESEGVLVLSERGYIDGKVQILKPHPNFRLFMSINHQYGELSRAMRNRGIEMALLADPTAEDWKRLRDHLRLPEAFSQDGNLKAPLIQYDAARRGLVLPKIPTLFSDVLGPSGRTLDQDSPLSNVTEQTALLSTFSSPPVAASESLLYFIARVVVPSYVPLLSRLLSASETDVSATSLYRVQRLLQTFLPQFLSITAGLREEYGRSKGFPLAFLLTQPADIFVGCNPCLDCNLEHDNPSLHHTILQILNLCVALFIYQEELDTSKKGRVSDTIQSMGIVTLEQAKIPRIVKAIETIMDTIATTGRMLFDKLDSGKLYWTSDLDLALNLLQHTRQLRVAITSRSSFDFSGVQAISKWIGKALRGCSPEFTKLNSDFKALHETISLSSGLGLAEIWSTLLVDCPIAPELTRLDEMACNLKETESIYGLRTQTFDLMTLRTRFTKTTEQEHLIANLTLEVVSRLEESARDDGIQRYRQTENGHLIAELAVLSGLGGCHDAIVSEVQAQNIQEIIELVCGNPHCRLLRLAPYQHALETVNLERRLLPIFAQCQIQWLSALWSSDSSDNLIEGPSMLLRPTQLRATMVTCDWRQKSLSSLKDYEATVRRHVRLTYLVCKSASMRTEQLASFLQQSILMIASCFPSSFDDTAQLLMRDLSQQSQLGEPPTIPRLLLLLEQSKHKPLLDATQHFLRPALLSLVNPLSSRSQIISSLGLGWVAFSRLIIDLYIPDIPIDPAAIQRCTQELLSQERAIVSTEINLHSQLELRNTGNDSNAITTFLQSRLNVLSESLASVPPLPLRDLHDVSRLQMFWSEVSQFQSQVISSSKMDSLLHLFESGDATAPMREQVVQQSITGFCQRLNAAYPDYTDITIALQLALLYLKLGLRLIAHSATSISDSASDTLALVGSALVAFPSVRSSTMLHAEEPNRPSGMTTSRYLLLKLAAVGFERSLGVDLEHHIQLVERTYDQILRLWLIDRARKNDLDLASQSLYKHLDYDGASDAEAEALEFLALFPQFEDALQNDTQVDKKSSHQPSLLFDAAHTQILADIHHSLLTVSQDSSSRPWVIFNNIRKLELESLLETQITSLSDVIDLQSYPFQFSLMGDCLSGLRGIFKSTEKPYNFYADANALEAKKAAVIIEKLKTRLDTLIREWPDQMVLQDLKSRCDLFLGLDLESPVAKILSALEQLLMHSEDWEIYANRENTLKENQQAIIALIVDWRRLELSSWQVLLQAQAKSFSDGTSEWWFHLCDAVIRGSLDALSRDSQDHFTNYLNTLCPLLDDFIRSSPLGQYHSRLHLLRSFARYANYLARSKSGHVRLGLDRVERVLHATAQYYGLFASSISLRFSEQQTRIEKEIRGFIKLASWKDINVHALKQSAQRTHRQLYNSVRKFRSVMRQPIVEWLQPELAGDAESKPLSDLATEPSIVPSPYKEPSFPDESSIGTLSNHLLNLDRTFQRFDTLITGRIRSFIDSHTAITVDNFAIDIISTVNTLSALSINNNDPPDRREKLQKALLSRKRRSWSDLLKELKRAGLAVNMKPDDQSRLGDMRWIREQPILTNPSKKFVSVEKCEIYLNRLYGSLPELRNLVSGHHPDLTTRELQRGVSLLESGFAMALDTRSCLAAAFESFHKLERMCRRLKMVPSSSTLTHEPNLTRSVMHVKDTVSKLENALNELMHGLHIFNDLQPNRTILPSLMERILTVTTTTKDFHDQLSAVLEDVKLTDCTLLLHRESDLVDDVLKHFRCTSYSLRQWSEEEPHLKYLFDPVQTWLNAQEISAPCSSELQPTAFSINTTDTVIDALLVNVQNLLATCSDSTNDYRLSEQDFYIRKDCGRLRGFTSLLNLDKVFNDLSGALPGLTNCPQDTLQRNLGRLMPFLDRYMELVEEQLTIHSRWMKALCKLDYVVCSVMHSVAKQGFCKPPDSGESSSGGDVSEAIDGVGLGEGSGAENVSKEIEEESQVEGLQSDVNDPQECPETPQDASAIEMSEDFAGDMEDIPETSSPDGRESDEESQVDPEEQLGKLDSSDPSAVDEKLWGDEQGPQEQADDKTNHDHSKHPGHSETVAKEKHSSPKQDPKFDDEEQEEESFPEDTNHEEQQYPDASGAPMDDHVPDAHTLDLPDDMDLDVGKEMEDAPTDHDDSDMIDDAQPELVSEDEGNDVDPPSQDDHEPTDQGQELEQSAQPQDSNVDKDVAEEDDAVVGQPDISVGQGISMSEPHCPDSGERAAIRDVGHLSGAAGQDSEAKGPSTNQDGSPEDVQPQDDPDASGEGVAGAATTGSRQRSGPSPRNQQSSNEPIRSLGDTLQQIRRPFEDICDGNTTTDPSRERTDDTMEESQLEYIQPDDSDHHMQALGPAGAEQVAKLNELKIVDDQVQIAAPLDVDIPFDIREYERPGKDSSILAEAVTDSMREHVEGAVTRSDQFVTPEIPNLPDDRHAQGDIEMVEADDNDVEAELKTWQAEGLPEAKAEHLWHRYEFLTHDLAYALCEQLRLILEPTLATRLKGDYRTGKRLNMKKIIPYIASDYTKDKIWLRRTRPSQREYQVLIALDDSRSMSESHSVHLAYQTLALMSKALSRLEVGDLALVRFGEAVEILHGFNEGPFTDQAGAKVMNAFQFNQTATNVLSLVEASLDMFEIARERRSISSPSAGDLWQLEIIISDGICQDHDHLRTVIRKAEEKRVMIVFIIIDSLLPTAQSTMAASTITSLGGLQNSILSMKQATYKNIDGRMELQMQRYLDSFPFEYYVVLRNVEALPEVLSATLRQFFERISEQ